MGFACSILENSPEQESKFLVRNPSMASNKDNNQCIQVVLDQENHDQMQQIYDDDHHQKQNNQISFGMTQSSSSSSTIPANFISKDNTGAYDLGELDQALFLYLDGQDQSTSEEQKKNSEMRPPTLNIFPSQPMHVEPSSSTKASTASLYPATNVPKKSRGTSVELSSLRNDVASSRQPAKAVKREGNRKGPISSSEQDGPKTPDPKTLRRLAQNREAARKSRLRKKAYLQQLESSRIRLIQLELELQRARGQGFYIGGNSLLGGQSIPAANISSDAAVFDMEYARWLEEHHRLMVALRSAMQEHVPENELRIFVDNCLAHYDQVMNLKSMIVKSDVFHLISGMWKTPAERCFMWIGGFRPSELIKIILSPIEPITEQQLLGMYGLRQSTREAEEALSQGLESLNQSLLNTITSDSLNVSSDMNSFTGQMALAINELSTFECLVRQADNLRHQILHRLHQILTTHQAARCFLAIAEYFHRLRALSSLWLVRPRPE